MTFKNQFEALIIQGIIEETAEARTFHVALENGAELSYKAGQFLTLAFPGEKQSTVRRSYSFSSAPLLAEPAAIAVKEVPNGMVSRKLMQAKVGDRLWVSDINGFFTLPDDLDSYRQLSFVVGGSGITPVLH